MTADLFTGAESLQLLLVGVADQHQLLHLAGQVSLLSLRLVHLFSQVANAVLRETSETDSFQRFTAWTIPTG